ncbi:lysozyme inhibitor LprI family protein [Oceanimonas sp. MB9]|uniref:lysozyme inhibitor LprI family protein n=1 Tax=Oceanimonas sp. MB9 TaxID=2588453 RepID=UPI0013F5CDC2|nr:lysozyme inhibitor LprI family protein [Oceanimonas sp. MB9]NHI00043.1 hypothetical protein [Oceanimonas sp. MB9]
MTLRLLLAAFWLLPALTLAATQVEMNQQSQRNYQAADRALNQAYGQLMNSLASDRRKKLKAAQRAWLRFRDAQAELVSSAYEGGSMQPLVHSEELRRLTESRTRELEQQFQEANR